MEDHVNYEVKRTGSEFDPIKYFTMFELSDYLEVKVLKDIGPQKKSVLVIDNFYKDPDSVRQLCLDSHKRNDPGLLSYLPGERVYHETNTVKQKIKHIFLMSYVLILIYGVVDSGKIKNGMKESGEDQHLCVML